MCVSLGSPHVFFSCDLILISAIYQIILLLLSLLHYTFVGLLH